MNELGPNPVDLGTQPVICAWCENEAVTEVIRVPGRKNRKTSPVCEHHAEDFERRGVMTVRQEVEQKLQADIKRSQKRNVSRW